MDFIKKLLSFSKFNTILIIVNQLTKRVIFISAHNTIMSVQSSCILQIWCSFLYYLQQRLRVCIKLFLFFRYCSGYIASLHFRLLPPKVMNKLNVWIKPSNNISVYIVTTNKIISLSSYLSWSLPIIMLQVLLLVFSHSSLIIDII